MLAVLAATALAAGGAALDDYAAIAAGRFSSEAQHARDPAYDWAEARVVRIWPERNDGIWLYQEQAIVNTPGLTPEQARARPYFQFVARVTQQLSGRPAPRQLPCARRGEVARHGRWRPAAGAALARRPRAASCHNRLERVAEGVYTGRTESCANAYKGAAWMQSLSVATRDMYVNWDRGFDAQGAACGARSAAATCSCAASNRSYQRLQPGERGRGQPLLVWRTDERLGDERLQHQPLGFRRRQTARGHVEQRCRSSSPTAQPWAHLTSSA
jgi:hypothetical protein